MTRGAPLVSIVVNNHDYAAFLPAAVESALAQSHPRVEVVVVDDGSTDGSREVIRGFGERVVAVLKPNGGQASAFNAGFRAARGELVHFLDADDLLDPRCAERVVDAWRGREGVSKLHFFLRIVDGAGRATGKAKPLYTERLPEGDVRPELAGSGGYVSPPTSGNVFARSFLERVMPVPEEDFRICADSYLCLFAPLFGEVAAVQEALGSYRVHGGNRYCRSGAYAGAGEMRAHRRRIADAMEGSLRACESLPEPYRSPVRARMERACRAERLVCAKVGAGGHAGPAALLALAGGVGRSYAADANRPWTRRAAWAAWWWTVALLPVSLATPLLRWHLDRIERLSRAELGMGGGAAA